MTLIIYNNIYYICDIFYIICYIIVYYIYIYMYCIYYIYYNTYIINIIFVINLFQVYTFIRLTICEMLNTNFT